MHVPCVRRYTFMRTPAGQNQGGEASSPAPRWRGILFMRTPAGHGILYHLKGTPSYQRSLAELQLHQLAQLSLAELHLRVGQHLHAVEPQVGQRPL
jgi:hypothetical protein